MVAQAGQTQWNPINDAAIENPEAKNADADYEARKNVDFAGNAKKVNEYLYASEQTCTPEEKEHNAEQFRQRYSSDLQKLFGTEISQEIGNTFEKNGDLEAAVFLAVSKTDVPDENKEALTEMIVDYLNPKITSDRIESQLKSEEGITVKPGMNASFLNSFSGSHRHITFSKQADNLQVGDTISYGEDLTSIMKNDTQIGELGTPDEGLSELTGKEFRENPYTPIIKAYIISGSENNDPKHDITESQSAEIEEYYTGGMDIIAAMGAVLDPSHEAIVQTKKLDNPDTIDERRSQMYQDLNVEDACKIDSKTGAGGDILTNLISENYTQILGSDGKVDTRASVILATQISANKIIEGKHTFKRTEEFTQAYARIQEGSRSPEQLSDDLLTIHKTVNNAEGISGKSKLTEAQRIQKAKQKSLFLEAEFREIQALFIKANETGNTQGMQEQEAADALQEKKVTGGEVISGGDLDLMAQLNNSTKETA